MKSGGNQLCRPEKPNKVETVWKYAENWTAGGLKDSHQTAGSLERLPEFDEKDMVGFCTKMGIQKSWFQEEKKKLPRSKVMNLESFQHTVKHLDLYIKNTKNTQQAGAVYSSIILMHYKYSTKKLITTLPYFNLWIS